MFTKVYDFSAQLGRRICARQVLARHNALDPSEHDYVKRVLHDMIAAELVDSGEQLVTTSYTDFQGVPLVEFRIDCVVFTQEELVSLLATQFSNGVDYARGLVHKDFK